jgi:MFS family permease
MHVQHGHSLSETAWVIQSHVLAMYLPSFFSGALIARFGAPRVMLAGAAAMAAMMAAGLQGHSVMHYWWSLVLLGVGWNFLFVGGTALLMESYRPAERFTAQAVNEFSVFGVSALGSLLAGALIHRYGWEIVLWSTGPALALVLASLAWLTKRGRSGAG